MIAVAVMFVLIGGLVFVYGVWDVLNHGQNSATIAIGAVMMAVGGAIAKMGS